MKYLPILFLILVTYQSMGQKKLEVGLRTGQVLFPESIVYKTPLLARSYLLINGEDKIEKDLIAYYQAADGFYRFADMGRGLMINRNTRIKRIAEGAIEAYE